MVRGWLSLTSRAAKVLSRAPYALRLALYYIAGIAIPFVLLGLLAPHGDDDAMRLVFAFLLLCLFGLPYAVSWFLFALFYRGTVIGQPREVIITGTLLVGVTRFVSLLLAPDDAAGMMQSNLRVAAAASIAGFVILAISTGAEVLISRRA